MARSTHSDEEPGSGGDAQELVALLDAVIGLLDARGDPAGLGTNLVGIYAQTWQEIVESLSSS